MRKYLYIFYVNYFLYLLWNVSYEFLSLPSRKCNVAERLIYMWLRDRSHVGAFLSTSSMQRNSIVDRLSVEFKETNEYFH